jgi:hypothetical protein
MRISTNRLKTVRRVMHQPGIHDDRFVGAGYDVAGCLKAGFIERRAEGLHVTPRGRAAASAHRTRVKSGAFRH